MTADRFELIVAQTLILRQLHGFIDSRILRIHGRRVADLLHELLNRREEETQKELEGLRLQYPGYAEEMERRRDPPHHASARGGGIRSADRRTG